MNLILLLIALTLLLGVLLALARTVVTDGFGTLPAPRSHREETGSWADRQLRR